MGLRRSKKQASMVGRAGFPFYISSRGVELFHQCHRMWWLAEVLEYDLSPVLKKGKGIYQQRRRLVKVCRILGRTFMISGIGLTLYALLIAFTLQMLWGISALMMSSVLLWFVGYRLLNVIKPQTEIHYADKGLNYHVPSTPIISAGDGLAGAPSAFLISDDRREVIPVLLLIGEAPHEVPYALQLNATLLQRLVDSDYNPDDSRVILRYPDLDVEQRANVDLNHSLDAILNEMRSGDGVEEIHRSHQDKGICQGCSVKEFCAESLA